MRDIVYFNGALVPRDDARVVAGDRGLTLGFGAFETLRCYGGRPFRLRAHLDRLWATVEMIGFRIPESPEQLTASARELVLQAGEGAADCRLRITVTAGPAGNWILGDGAGVGGGEAQATRLMEVQPLDLPQAVDYDRGVRTVTQGWPGGAGPLAGHKVTSFLPYVQARRAATLAGAQETIIVAPEPVLVEGAMSNLFLVRDGEVLTPPLADGPLPGVTRGVVLELAKARGLGGGERRLTRADLDSAEELFLTASIAEVLPVSHVDGLPVGKTRPGPVTRKISADYSELAMCW